MVEESRQGLVADLVFRSSGESHTPAEALLHVLQFQVGLRGAIRLPAVVELFSRTLV